MMKKTIAVFLSAGLLLSLLPSSVYATEKDKDIPEVTLRVCNWEEYIDEGDWDEEEAIELDDGETIIGENSVVEDFEEWYLETYGIKVNVEYSCFGTCEDLYNMLTLGDVYDLICPSEYLFMKLIDEGWAVPLSEDFFDTSDPNNYYINGVSPFIKDIYDSHEINGEPWSDYAAGFMWGVTGFVYNPELMSEEDASTWKLIENTDYARQITVKDNVRDTFFAAVGAEKSELLTSEAFLNDPDYKKNLENEMNDTSNENIAAVQTLLQNNAKNFYSFETDSGKADMITGKVAANYQWSGDAVYTMDQAEEDDCYLNFAVPVECTNIWFDGWLMLKKGIEQDPLKQQAAEAWINFCSRPDIAIRNMYYIGYSSVISGGDDPRIFEYINWNFAAEEEEEDTTSYDLTFFFTGKTDGSSEEEYVMTVPTEQTKRQLYAQYPDLNTINRASIMTYFKGEAGTNINQMWINVRCFNIHRVPVWAWGLILLLILLGLAWFIHSKREKVYNL